MKITFTILFLLYTSLSVFSQGAFHLKHNVPYNSVIYDIAECEKGYLLVGASEENSKTIGGGYLLLLNKKGDIIWEKVATFFLYAGYEDYRVVVYHDGYFYISGTIRENTKKISILIKMNDKGIVSYAKTFGQETQLGYDNLIKKSLINDNGILVASSGFNETATRGELIQIDFEGTILWNKFFSYNPTSNDFWENFDDMKRGKDGNLVLTLTSSANNIDFEYKSIIKVKPNGEELWRKVFDTRTPSTLISDTLKFKSVTPYKDNHVLAYFSVLTIPQVDLREDIVLIEYDEYGNELNYKRFYNPHMFGYNNISTNKINEIFIAGSRYFNDSISLSILKINTNNEIEWDKTYYKKQSPIVDSNWMSSGESFVFGMNTSDNGYILTGIDMYTISHEFYWNSTILKVDCNGNTVWDYSSCLSPDFDDITIFPNPSSDNFIIQLPSVHAKDDIQLKVYDIMGKLVYKFDYTGSEVVNLNASSWSIGTYICRISINNELVKTEKLVKI